jgi:hypothetical protein
MTSTDLKRLIDRLRAIGLLDATVRRYRQHLAACERLNSPDLVCGFERFALDVLTTPAQHRADLLAETVSPSPEPRRKFLQYVPPKEVN